jgi:group I intron endonuclease
MYVYKITNLINGKIYVGQRKRNYLGDENYLGSGKLIMNSVKKNGKENFRKEIICECCNQEEMNKMETFWIQELKAHDRNIGYNISKTNFGGDIFTNNPEKEKIREKKILSYKNKSFEELLIIRLKKIETYNKKSLTDKLDRNQRISENLKGHVGAWKGKNHTDEYKKNMSISCSKGQQAGPNNPMFGKKFKWMHKNDVRKHVLYDDVENFLKNGWILGRGKNINSKNSI